MSVTSTHYFMINFEHLASKESFWTSHPKGQGNSWLKAVFWGWYFIWSLHSFECISRMEQIQTSEKRKAILQGKSTFLLHNGDDWWYQTSNPLSNEEVRLSTSWQGPRRIAQCQCTQLGHGESSIDHGSISQHCSIWCWPLPIEDNVIYLSFNYYQSDEIHLGMSQRSNFTQVVL